MFLMENVTALYRYEGEGYGPSPLISPCGSQGCMYFLSKQFLSSFRKRRASIKRHYWS